MANLRFDEPRAAVSQAVRTADHVALSDHGAYTHELHVEKISNYEEFEALAPEWQALDAALFPRLPFTSPEWNLLWWTHFRRDRMLFRDRLNAYAVRDGSGELVAVAPMMITSRPSVGPLRVRELQFLGADHNVTELRGVVCRRTDLPAVMDALRKAIALDKSDWDWVQWRGLRTGAGVTDWRQLMPKLKPMGTVPNYYLPLPKSWAELKAGLPRNIKESLRKCYNSLARDGHSFTFAAVEDPEALPAALDCFLALHGARASLSGTIDHPNCFAAPEAQSFLRDYAAHLAQTGAMRVFQLKIGDEVVATRVAFLLGQEMYLYFSGYNPDWKRYSVMTTLLAEALQWGIANGYRVANLSMGQDVSKTRWRPEVTEFAEGFEVAPTMRAGLAFEVMSRLRRSMKGSVAQGSAEGVAHA